MRRSALFLMAAIGACLAFGVGATPARVGGVPAATPAPIGPGLGGVRYPGIGAQFVGVTTRHFPPGVGALAASRACNEEFPVSRLCEWADIFRAIPPLALDKEVLVAPNYETRPVPTCLNPNGGLACSPSVFMRPAACCGFFLPPPPPPAPGAITLTPSDPQTVTACSNTFEFTATAYDAQGIPLAGIPLIFEFPPTVGGTVNITGFFNPSSGLSDENGRVTTTLTFFESSCQFNCTGRDCSAEIQAHDLGRTVFSNAVTLVDAIP